MWLIVIDTDTKGRLGCSMVTFAQVTDLPSAFVHHESGKWPRKNAHFPLQTGGLPLP